MTWSQLPNALTVFRILLVPPAMFALLAEHYRAALLIVAVAGATDGLDGFLARRFGWTSRLGSILDPIADKLLLVSTYGALAWLGHLPMWLAGMVVLRDIVIMAGALTYRFMFDPFDMEPSRFSKVNTLLQISLAVLVLVSLAGVPVPELSLHGLVALVAASTIGTGAHYVWTWSGRARRKRRGQ